MSSLLLLLLLLLFYLSTSFERYKAEVAGAGASKSGALCDSLGALALFLAEACLFHTLPLTGKELDALETLVRSRKSCKLAACVGTWMRLLLGQI
jgi:hypothetical protein